MANTIKIKRGAYGTTGETTPSTLAEGELAYAQNGDKLFIGTNGGADIVTIGGKVGDVVQAYDANIVSDANYVATANDFTTTLKNKLDGIEESANDYLLPVATDAISGGIKVGTNLSIDSTTGVLSAQDSYSLPTATDSTLGGVKVGANLSMNASSELNLDINGTSFFTCENTTTNDDRFYFLGNLRDDTVTEGNASIVLHHHADSAITLGRLECDLRWNTSGDFRKTAIFVGQESGYDGANIVVRNGAGNIKAVWLEIWGKAVVHVELRYSLGSDWAQSTPPTELGFGAGTSKWTSNGSTNQTLNLSPDGGLKIDGTTIIYGSNNLITTNAINTTTTKAFVTEAQKTAWDSASTWHTSMVGTDTTDIMDKWSEVQTAVSDLAESDTILGSESAIDGGSF
jgi:hypothetical protein